MIFRGPFEMAFEFAEMVVREDAHRRAAEARAVNERGMAELVQDDHIILTAQRAERPERGGVAAGKCERGFRALEICDRAFELRVRREAAGDEARRAAADAVAIDRGLRGFLQRGLSGETEVVVRCKADQAFSIRLHLGLLRGVECAQPPQQ